jgi:alpha/beta superfamily hydrolase
VGRSTGGYDEGRGEQEDIIAACKYLQNIGIIKLSFAGYSFGAWVGSKVIDQADNPFTSATFISPPINYFDFDFTKANNNIKVIICGSNDQFCNLDVLKDKINHLNTNLIIIPDADHFYLGKEKEIIKVLQENINS